MQHSLIKNFNNNSETMNNDNYHNNIHNSNGSNDIL